MNHHDFGVYCWVAGGPLEESRKWLGYFGLFPTWLQVFYYTLVLILNDVFFFVASILINWVMYSYLLGLSHAFRSERPAVFDHEKCRVPQFAVPDAPFVTYLSFWAVITIGVMMHDHYSCHVGLSHRIMMLFFPIMYVIGLMANEYFFWWQLLLNLALVVVTALVFILVYREAARFLKFIPGFRRWCAQTLGLNSAVFAPDPLYCDERYASSSSAATLN